MRTWFTRQSASLQSAFVTHRHRPTQSTARKWHQCRCTLPMLGAHATLPISIIHVNNCIASGGGCLGSPGASTYGTAARQSYTPMASKPVPSSQEPACQWNQAPVTLIYQWKNKGGGRAGVKE